ncbi:MAG: hypothetical protein J6Y95_02935, partial [Lachnospiraceae bacterium]|nr:hypothetical protein [Lachnospiraceae bacterium]
MKRNRILKILLAGAFAAALIFTSSGSGSLRLRAGIPEQSVQDNADRVERLSESESTAPGDASLPDYGEYIALHGEIDGHTPDRSVTVDAASFREGTGAYVTNYMGRDNVLYWDEEGTSVCYTVEIPEEGYYQLSFTYNGVTDKNYDIILDVAVDGELPFQNSSHLKLRRLFLDETYLGYGD